jgi:hypothetical protein
VSPCGLRAHENLGIEQHTLDEVKQMEEQVAGATPAAS